MKDFAVPGTIIHHVPAATRNYVGCPSIAVLPSGGYVASHSYFGHGATNSDSFVYRSADRGKTWERIADIHNQIWSKLFLCGGKLYIIGTDHCDQYGGRLNGKMVIKRSDDEGITWTEATSSDTGLLSDEDGYHTAPTAAVVHNGRIWKGFEFAPESDRKTWRVFVISAPTDSDLLNRDSWTFSEQIETWPDYQWIEGNMVLSPDGQVVDVLRSNYMNRDRLRESDEPATLVKVSPDGKHLTHDPDSDRLVFPGGGTKFTIKYDPESSKYYALVNPQPTKDIYRNILAMSVSEDLRSWRIARELIRHPDPVKHAFQYVDWDFDGVDIVYTSRTAYDDGLGGANRAHDANYLTFGRIENFRE
ncbi:MAG: exo-alpha-sialidase [Spirochaetales bacterium]|nr:exo-alpha-sialidase [Spirochaetales bacterium]